MLSRKTMRATIAVGAGGTAQSPAHLNYNVSTNVGTYTNKLSVETWNANTISCSTIGATAITGQTINLGQLGGPWTSRTSAANNSWWGVTYGNSIYVAVSTDGTNRVMTSPDGITWTSRSAAAANQWLDVTYGGGLFVAVSNTGTNNRVMTSSDGISWTSRTSAVDNSWISVTWGNDLFVAVSVTGSGNRVMTSPNGITWTSRTSAADNDWSAVAWGNGLFVAVSYNGANRVMTSPDGITWTSRTAASNIEWYGVTYGEGIFVAVGKDSTNFSTAGVMTSPDGITWTLRYSSHYSSWRAVTYGNGLFVATSLDGTGNRVMTSPNGINWIAGTTPANNSWISVTYGNNLFVAVSVDGTGNRVMTWNGSAGSITCGQVVSPIIQGPTGYNLSLEAGGTGYSLTSLSIYNTTTASSANVAITGTTGMFQRSTSSIRYKTDVEDLSLADAEKVWDMRPVWYRSTCLHDRKDWSYYGMIAEEVAAIDPRVCFWDENGQVEGVMYDRIVPMFLRTQKEEYAKMTSEIGDLKDRVLRL